MPIPVSELRKPQPSLTARVLELLGKDPAQAYSLVEVLSVMLSVPVDDLLSYPDDQARPLAEPVFTALRELVRQGQIEEIARGDDVYFFVREGA